MRRRQCGVEVREGVAADVEGEAVEGEEVDEDGSEAAAARAQAREGRNAAIADATPAQSCSATPTVSRKICPHGQSPSRVQRRDKKSAKFNAVMTSTLLIAVGALYPQFSLRSPPSTSRAAVSAPPPRASAPGSPTGAGVAPKFLDAVEKVCDDEMIGSVDRWRRCATPASSAPPSSR